MIHQGTEEHATDDTEDRGIGADAERERHHHGGGQTPGAQERAEADSHVLPEGRDRVKPAAVPDAPHRVADGRNVTEFPQCSQPGGLRILAALDPFLHAEGHVAADFVVEIAIVGTHRLLLPCRRRIHDAADRVHQLRPAIPFA